MSDSFTAIVDSYISSEDALDASRNILRFLSEERIIENKLSDCVLNEPRGYRPGIEFLSATELVEDFNVINCNYDDFSRMKTNGLSVSLERCVVMDPSGDLNLAKCPSCAEHSSMDDRWSEAMTQWHAGSGAGLLICSNCKQSSEVIKWDHQNALAAGNLAFTFWNWPQLSDNFVQSFSDTLGNPVRTVIGRI